jgi:hypothetical protein
MNNQQKAAIDQKIKETSLNLLKFYNMFRGLGLDQEAAKQRTIEIFEKSSIDNQVKFYVKCNKENEWLFGIQ